MCPGCPCGYLCIAGTALIIAILALIIASIPLIMYASGDYDQSTQTHYDYGAALLQPTPTKQRLVHRISVDATRPNFSYLIHPLETLESECFGDTDCSMKYFVGSTNGWDYRWWKTFNGNVSSGDRLYPYSTLNVKYGDKLVFRTAQSTKDDVILVPEEIFNSCNFSLDEYAEYYLNDDGDIDVNSSLYLASWSDIYQDRSDAAFVASNTTWNEEWDKEYMFTIEDRSNLLPCDDTDLYCKLITADTLYFTTSRYWWRTWRPGNCLGDWRAFYSKDDYTGQMGLKLKVTVEGSHTRNLDYAEADSARMLDPDLVQDLQYAIGTMGRTLILSQFSDEQRIRSEGMFANIITLRMNIQHHAIRTLWFNEREGEI